MNRWTTQKSNVAETETDRGNGLTKSCRSNLGSACAKPSISVCIIEDIGELPLQCQRVDKSNYAKSTTGNRQHRQDNLIIINVLPLLSLRSLMGVLTLCSASVDFLFVPLCCLSFRSHNRRRLAFLNASYSWPAGG